jgi:SAM-dependent methyltransferase
VRPDCGRTRPGAGFDEIADRYDTLLERSLRVTGEDNEYFARGRMEWLASRLARERIAAGTVVDFGCGAGAAIPLLFDVLGAVRVIAIDESEELLKLAKSRYGDRNVSFFLRADSDRSEACDLAYCSAVFHHIPPAARPDAARAIRDLLKPGGVLALWEHNAWSPAARYVMSRCEFDRGTRPLSAGAARRLLAGAGFEILRTDFLFIFPRLLRMLRWSERLLSGLPLGAQFQVLARRPG